MHSTATVESSMELPQKTKNGTIVPYGPTFPILGIYSKKPGILIQKNICTSLFLAALFTIAKI